MWRWCKGERVFPRRLGRGTPFPSGKGNRVQRVGVGRRLRGSAREALVAVAAQDRVEALAAEVEAARFVVGDGGAADVAAANRPNPADHRMPPLAIAEEIIRELTQHTHPRFRAESAARAYGEHCVQEARDRVEAGVRVAIRAEPAFLVQL